MIALKIEDSKAFMNMLIKGEIFDYWEGRQIEIHTYTHFKMDCKINKNFYDSDELEMLGSRHHETWEKLKQSVFSLIKGSKPPTSMKIVLAFPVERIKDVDTSNVDGLFINVHLENKNITVTTGTSTKTFSMDKTIDHHWDHLIRSLLKKQKILYNEL